MQTCCARTCRGEGPRPWFIIKSWDHLCSKRIYCPNLTSFSPGKFWQCVENWPQKIVFLLTHLNYFWPFPDFSLFSPHLFFQISLKIQGFPTAVTFYYASKWVLVPAAIEGWEKNIVSNLLHQKNRFFIYFCVWCKHQKICFCFGVCGDSGSVTVEQVQQSAPFGSYA